MASGVTPAPVLAIFGARINTISSGAGPKSSTQWRPQINKAIDLAPIGVTLGHNVDKAQAFLLWTNGLLRQQDQTGAGPKDRAFLGMKLLERRTHGNRCHEFEQRRALSPRDNQPMHLCEFMREF